MILIITNTEDLTADYVVLRLQEKEIPYFRFNVDRFPGFYRIHHGSGLQSWGAIEDPHRTVALSDFSAVWYRRLLLPPVAPIFEEETRPYIQHESRHFLEGMFLSLNIPWVNPLAAVHAAERKLFQLRCARECDLPIPETLVANDAQSLRDFAKVFSNVICKPVYSGLQITSQGAFSAYTREITIEDLNDEGVLNLCPTLIQRRIHKQADIRLTFFGERAFAVAIRGEGPQPLDWRRPGTPLKYEVIDLPSRMLNGCQQLMRKLGLVYGAFDFVQDESGDYYFLEVNPTGEWAWLDDVAGLSLRDELIGLLQGQGG